MRPVNICPTRDLWEILPFTLFCRAGVHARRTNNFFKFYNVQRGQDPALQDKINNTQTGYRQRSYRFAGGMYAAPTHRPNTITVQKRYIRRPPAGRIHAAPTMQGKHHTTHKRPIPAPFAGGISAAPTHGPNAVATQKRYRGATGPGRPLPPPFSRLKNVPSPFFTNAPYFLHFFVTTRQQVSL